MDTGLGNVPLGMEIIKATAETYAVSVDDIRFGRRTAELAWPRHIAMYLCRSVTGASYPAIGRLFGGKDHTSTLYAYRRINRLIPIDPNLTPTLSGIYARASGYAAERIAANPPIALAPKQVRVRQNARPQGVMSASRMSRAIDRADWLELGGEIAA